MACYKDSFFFTYTAQITEGLKFEYQYGLKHSLLHTVQTSPAAQPASYPMEAGGSFSESKAAVVWLWPLTSN
jgi:hypothetical protein